MKIMKKFYIKTMKITLRFVYFLLFINICLFAQDNEIGNLEKSLPQISGREKVDILNRISYLLTQNNVNSSISYAEQALKLAVNLNYKKGESYALANLGYSNYLKGNTLEAKTYFQSALQNSEKSRNYFAQAYSNIGLGLINWRAANYKDASSFFNKAIAISEKYGIKEMLGRAYSYSGLLYWKWSDYKKALELYFKALKIKESINNEFEIGVTLNNIAYVYNEIKDFDKSITYSLRAKQIGEKLKNDFVLGRAYSNLAISYLGLNKIQEAIDYNKKSLNIKLLNNDKRGIGFSYIDLGNIYMSVQKYQLALENFHKAYRYMKDANDNYGKALALSKIGQGFLQLGDYENALKNFDLSQNIAVRDKLKAIQAENLMNLSLVNQKQKNYTRAFEYLKKYTLISDSLKEEQSLAKLSELQIKYELDKTTSENELLKKNSKLQELQIEKNTVYVHALIGISILLSIVIFTIYSRNRYITSSKKEIENKNIEIEKSKKHLEEVNKNKDKFFSIISHDLRSPFQALLGYTGLILSEYDFLTDEERKKYVAEIDTVFKSTLQLFENLLSWARVQDGKLDYNPIIINLQQVLNETLHLLSGMAKRKDIQLISEISFDEFVYIDMYYIQTVLRNLISNSIKFTKPGGFIKVYVKTINNKRTIIVEDSGVGMTKDIADKLFTDAKTDSTVGTDKEVGSGIGLSLCYELVKRYNGKIWVESELGKGSKFYFTIPVE